LNVNFANRSVVVRAPAKLNLFLELLRRREDGFHDIDTVMLPINCYDTLSIRCLSDPLIRLRTNWWPSRQQWAQTLGVKDDSPLLFVPDDERNLVHRALLETARLTNTTHGFDVEVRKRIPAGAGMGGASSDAAAAIRAVAALTGIASTDRRLWQIASKIGSDVPFFLGDSDGSQRISAMRATGRGEVLSRLQFSQKFAFLVVYPAESLSTAMVYRHSTVPHRPESAEELIRALVAGNLREIGKLMSNRLAEPATKLSAMVADLLEQMWRCGLPRCQLTGSGSACFSLLDDESDVDQLQRRLVSLLRVKGIRAHIIQARNITIPRRVRQSR
jgi:4-diphosphocytidyl-2-C-methyl-D-erythritol kinase